MRNPLFIMAAVLGGCSGAPMMGDDAGSNGVDKPDMAKPAMLPDLAMAGNPDLVQMQSCIPPQEHAPTGMPIEAFGDSNVLTKKWYVGGKELQMDLEIDNQCTSWVGLSWNVAGISAGAMLVISKYRLAYNCGPKRDAGKPCFVAIFTGDFQSFMTTEYSAYPVGQSCDTTGSSDNPNICKPDRIVGSGNKPH